MATNFPASLDSYSTKAAGNTIAEGHVNDPQDAIEIIEQKVGIGASATIAQSASTNTALLGYGASSTGFTTISLNNTSLCKGPMALSLLPTGITGTLTAGTPCVQNPFTVQTKTTQAHGLGAIPTVVDAYFECLSADNNYAAGDRIPAAWVSSQNAGSIIRWDATNIYILSSNNQPYALDGTTPQAGVALTAVKWKVVAVPYKLN